MFLNDNMWGNLSIKLIKKTFQTPIPFFLQYFVIGKNLYLNVNKMLFLRRQKYLSG